MRRIEMAHYSHMTWDGDGSRRWLNVYHDYGRAPDRFFLDKPYRHVFGRLDVEVAVGRAIVTYRANHAAFKDS